MNGDSPSSGVNWSSKGVPSSQGESKGMTGGSLKSSSAGEVNSGDKKSENGVPSMKGDPWWSLNCGESSCSMAASDGSRRGCVGGKRPAGAVKVALGAVAKLWAKVAEVATASWPEPAKAEIIAAVEAEMDTPVELELVLLVLLAVVIVVVADVLLRLLLLLLLLLAVMFMY